VAEMKAVAPAPKLSTREVSPSDARSFASYAYPPPYDFYDSAPGSAASFLEPRRRYVSVVDRTGELWGFGCFGVDAQVPGGAYAALPGALDVGVGMAPERVGRGYGRAFARAVLRQAAAPEIHWFRVSVAAFNLRSLRLWRSLGFADLGRFVREGSSREFIQLAADATELERRGLLHDA
jgi:RimJ/RimL family protein N-acetyltransferase